jgi:hypothetical protein
MGQQRGATLEPRISLDTFLQIFAISLFLSTAPGVFDSRICLHQCHSFGHPNSHHWPIATSTPEVSARERFIQANGYPL